MSGDDTSFMQRKHCKPKQGNDKDNRQDIDRVPKQFKIQHGPSLSEFGGCPRYSHFAADNAKIRASRQKGNGYKVFR
jgi:hypothetical protein